MRDPYLIKSVAHSALLMAAFEPGEVLTQRDLVQRTGLSRGISYGCCTRSSDTEWWKN